MQHFPFPAFREKGTSQWPQNEWSQVVHDLDNQICSVEVNWIPMLQINFHIFDKPHAAFPFSCIQKKGHLNSGHKINDVRGCMSLDNQIGSYAIHISYFWKINFHFFNKPHAGFPFFCIHRKGHLTVATEVNDIWGCTALDNQISLVLVHWTHF